jgi:MFS family permease
LASALSPGRRAAASTLLIGARVVYAYNWYNVGAVLPLLGTSFHAGSGQLGIVLGAFLFGVAIFQVPAGLASARFGPRRVSLAGIALFGAAGVASAFAPSWPVLALLRAVGGIGAAFFFAPALSLVASYYKGSQRGPLIGLYNGGFSIGGAAGLLVGAELGLQQGWPAALGYGGLALLLITLIAWLVVPTQPDGPGRERGQSTWATGLAVLRSRSIWALSISVTGFWAAVFIVAQYLVDYAQAVHPAWGIPATALLAAVVVFIAFPGGPIGGWIAERGRDRRLLIGLSAAAGSAVVAIVPFASFLELWPILLAAGFFDGVTFAILYLIPTYLPETRGQGLALGVGVVNSLQVMLGSLIAVAFGFLAASEGYTVAWLFAGAISVALLPALYFVAPNRAPPRRPVSEGASVPS